MVTNDTPLADAALSAKPSRRTGFTMIELLVVIAIISILMGLIITTSGLIRKRARIEATRTLLLGISAGLNRFYIEFGQYPPSTSDDLGDKAVKDSLYKCLCSSDRNAVEDLLGYKTHSGKSLEPYLDVPSEYLMKDGETVILIDSWGSPIIFLNCQAYTQTKQADDPAYLDDGKCHNPQSFDLYSPGPDKQFDPKTPGDDDITNWAEKL